MAFDGRGTKLKVGDRLVYPCRAGSIIWMAEGIITQDVDDATVQIERQREFGRGFKEEVGRRKVRINTARAVRISESKFENTLRELVQEEVRRVI